MCPPVTVGTRVTRLTRLTRLEAGSRFLNSRGSHLIGPPVPEYGRRIGYLWLLATTNEGLGAPLCGPWWYWRY